MVHTASFRHVHRPAGVCLVVEGAIDPGSVPHFTAAIFDAVIVADEVAVLDLTGVTSFGSEGIGCLLTGQALANDHGIELVIEPSRIVRRVLVVVGMADYFKLRAVA